MVLEGRGLSRVFLLVLVLISLIAFFGCTQKAIVKEDVKIIEKVVENESSIQEKNSFIDIMSETNARLYFDYQKKEIFSETGDEILFVKSGIINTWEIGGGICVVSEVVFENNKENISENTIIFLDYLNQRSDINKSIECGKEWQEKIK